MPAREQETMPTEWPHSVLVDDIDDKPLKLTISPSETQRRALVKRLDLLSLDDLEAKVTLGRDPGSMVVHVIGNITAKISQNCVVSMEPIESEIVDEFEAWYADPEAAVSLRKAKREQDIKKGRRETPILEESEDPEPIVDGEIDVGELVTQYLSLAINPYPHAEGVEYEHGDDEKPSEPSEIRKNPFAALKSWKAQKK